LFDVRLFTPAFSGTELGRETDDWYGVVGGTSQLRRPQPQPYTDISITFKFLPNLFYFVFFNLP